MPVIWLSGGSSHMLLSARSSSTNIAGRSELNDAIEYLKKSARVSLRALFHLKDRMRGYRCLLSER